MKIWKRHRTVDEIMAQCIAEGINLDMDRYINAGSDFIVLRSPGVQVLYSTFNGRFFGSVSGVPGQMEKVEFSSDEDRPDGWYQRLIEFFYTDEELPL